MNRVIKFRYIYSDGGNFIFQTLDLTQISNGECYEVTSNMPLLKKYKHIGQVQFTGLLDKDGKEIYEGDIVQYTIPSLDETEQITYTEEVSFDAGCFNVDAAPVSAFHDISEIVGNIFENPNLLNR